MIEIEIKAAHAPEALASVIATAQGDADVDPFSAVGRAATPVQSHQQAAEEARPSRNELETVDFQKLDPDSDWSDL